MIRTRSGSPAARSRRRPASKRTTSFLEEEGNKPDTPLSDSQAVTLSGKVKHFFAVPPATFVCTRLLSNNSFGICSNRTGDRLEAPPERRSPHNCLRREVTAGLERAGGDDFVCHCTPGYPGSAPDCFWAEPKEIRLRGRWIDTQRIRTTPNRYRRKALGEHGSHGMSRSGTRTATASSPISGSLCAALMCSNVRTRLERGGLLRPLRGLAQG